MDEKRIHFIGICGVAMSALAVAMKKNGHVKLPDGRHVTSWAVTGSDRGFYPPVSICLKDAGIEYYPGWHVDLMTKDGVPDLVVVGNVAGSHNPEWLYVKDHDIPYVSYPELIAKYFVRPNSIVCAGTFGKTTSAALLTWILKENGYDPSYMFGGVSLNEMDSAAFTDSSYSILEGDEYKTSSWDPRPKFAHYSPTHLLLTSVEWDHADVYPKESLYVDAFKSLIERIPQAGLLVLSEKVSKIKRSEDQKIITYGHNNPNYRITELPNYCYMNVQTSKSGISFDILHNEQTYHIATPLLGDYMADNITGCFAMAHQIGIKPEGIIKAIESFKSIKRRLEKRLDGPITIFDDIAHSPAKSKAVLASLRKLYDGKIIAVFEPNTGNRKKESFPSYDQAFNSADIVIIPRLTSVKIAADDPSPPVEGDALADAIKKTHKNVRYIDDDEKLVQYIIDDIRDGDVVVFLVSHGFRGMIEQLCLSFRGVIDEESLDAPRIPFSEA